MDGKNVKYMDNMQLPSKKRNMEYLYLYQIQNGMINSSMDELPKNNLSGLSKGSNKQMVASPKRMVSMWTRTKDSMVIIEFFLF